MGRVLTNNTSLAYSIEASLGVAGTVWTLVEPNTISTFGATTTTVARAPISKNRQRRKGTVTDLDSAVEYDADLTLSSFQDFVEGFAFAAAINAEMDIGIASVDGTADEYTVSAATLTVQQANKLEFSAAQYASLILARGFTNAVNNGLKQLNADVAVPVAATGVLTLAANAADGDTVTIDTKVYTFQATLTDVDGNVLVGATASDSIDNLIAAITLGAGSGTLYAASTTLHPTVTASAGAGDTMDATAKTPGSAGNSIATTETGLNMSWGNATLTGGTDSTLIEVTDTGLVDEASPPSEARIELAGLRSLAAAADFTWDFTSGAPGTARLISAADITDFSQFGLSVGQMAHIGSPDGSGGVTNAFQNLAANDIFGYARIKQLGVGFIEFDKLDAALQFDDLTAPTTAVDVLFGKFVRNVPVDDTDFLERSFQFELAEPNLQNPGPGDEYEYAKGNLCNTLGFNLPLTDKAGVTFGFVGTDTDDPTSVRKSGAATPLEPKQTVAFNTSSDVARLRITDVDETGLTTDFKSLTLTLNNNVSPEKVLGQLGAKFMNFGDFEVDIETQLLFTNSDVVARIKANTTVTMDFNLKNEDGAIFVDIPSMTLGSGGKDLPVNESVLLNVTAQAHLDNTLNTSIGISIFPIVP